MITTHRIEAGRLIADREGAENLSAAAWIDILDPTDEDARRIEAALGLDLPTREDMAEIEHSSRLYSTAAGAFLTATLPARAEDGNVQTRPVTFVLTGPRLLTIRHHAPQAFRVVPELAARSGLDCVSADDVLLILLEAVVDREADILERAGRDIDAISHAVFRPQAGRPAPTPARDFHHMLGRIGRSADTLSGLRDSLTSLERMAGYLAAVAVRRRQPPDLRDRIRVLARDIRSLSGHIGFLEDKVAFLLDATLGLIGIEQNATIKIFSVVAVVFLPPTLLASIWGMNYARMPELDWWLGYPLALGAMIVSAILPYAWFRRRGWL